ncbi:MAG: anthranilate synthase component I [Actinomycetota bacterium]
MWREILADFHTPVGAIMRLDPRPDGFLLESVEGGERWARYSFLGVDAAGIVTAKDGRVAVRGYVPNRPAPDEPPLAYVKRLLGALRAPRVEGLPPLHGGAVGYIGYDCVRELENLPAPPPDDIGLPDLALMLTRTLVVFDHFSQRAFVISNAFAGSDARADYEAAAARCDEIVGLLSEPVSATATELTLPEDVSFSSAVDDSEFCRWVEVAKEHVYAGDVFQVVPSRRFEAPMSASALSAYRVLRTTNPSPYMYFLRWGPGESHPAFEMAGSSPEPLVRVTGDLIVTRPIAGTRRRGETEEEDAALADELLADAKERAEHVMLVDLARNDVGRVARYGTVSVDELMVIERYSHVMHIVSSVSGRLAAGVTGFDALLACFPAGTVSGAPKVRAMEIINSLEHSRRGPYAGAVGYFDFSGDLDTCITIRTIVASGERAYVQAGAGVVADSVPEGEADETRRKAEGMLRAVAAAAALEGRG